MTHNRQASRNPRGATPSQIAGTVPGPRQVVPEAAVLIVTKKDQPTGRETAGVVQDVLTRGWHPRGMKVRLRDGQIGRVQRMADGDSPVPASSGNPSPSQGGTTRAPPARRWRHTADIRSETEYPEGPPPRSLADFMPATVDSPSGSYEDSPSAHLDFGKTMVKCPLCDEFEGDENAVTHHVEQAHPL
ncbi:hypothetical protein B0I35DRAFT_474991 [Stachybotrys elegans]|uniref:UBZ4-type domain-containing protein n=1 Tax=Stachybotrys elegans TaxID=80388 RepID=A0A8K0T4I1_9HYPO|nr:hypothetical protein B0I35DRAFT_474991 [Stachybotrys elegans]